MNRAIFLLASLVIFLSSSVSATSAQRPRVIQWLDCPTRSLDIVLNVENESKKKDLIGALQALAEYPALNIEPVRSERSEIIYTASSLPCDEDEYCAAPEGWTELQWRLKAFKGVQVTCSANPPDSGDEEQQEEQPDQGGVDGNN